MADKDPFQEKNLKQIQLFIYLVPVVGFFPSLWTLYRDKGSKEQKRVSRLSVTLALSWLLAYSLLWMGSAQGAELTTIRLLFINSMLTSGYFLVCLGLMVRLWKHKSPRLPVFSRIAEGLVRKYLSS